MINKDWSRWIKIAIKKHFTDNKGSLNILFDPQEQLQNEYVQIRINGPVFNRLPARQYTALVDVNAIINILVSKTDLYKADRVQGLVESLFVENLNIQDDDLVFVSCLSKVGRVVATYFGKNHDEGIQQVAVESQYKTTLQE